MTNHDQSRRDLFTLVALGAAAASGITLTATSAEAYQGNMESALSSLQDAMTYLRQATPDKGGHRGRAMNLIERAMGQVQAGIDFASRRHGD